MRDNKKKEIDMRSYGSLLNDLIEMAPELAERFAIQYAEKISKRTLNTYALQEMHKHGRTVIEIYNYLSDYVRDEMFDFLISQQGFREIVDSKLIASHKLMKKFANACLNGPFGIIRELLDYYDGFSQKEVDSFILRLINCHRLYLDDSNPEDEFKSHFYAKLILENGSESIKQKFEKRRIVLGQKAKIIYAEKEIPSPYKYLVE